MLFNSYTSVSRLINTEPSELLRLRLSEPIASESVEYQVDTRLIGWKLKLIFPLFYTKNVGKLIVHVYNMYKDL